MTANDVGRALASALGEFHNHAAVPHANAGRLERVVAGIHEWLVIVADWRMRRSFDKPHLAHLFDGYADGKRAVHFHVINFSDLAMFRQHPKLFEDFVELLFVCQGKNFLGRNFAMM